MAYNKSKNADAAQKFLHQGKTAQAITEYLTILKHEPKDQVTLMTVGDLYVRQGETFLALEYFEQLAQLFLSDGFVTKAIAIYKKIAKLAPEENRPVERLAELYIQQGVLSEARPIYLQLAESHQRAGRYPQAAALLRKLHDAEPENLRVLTQLADLLQSTDQKADAAALHRAAAEQLQRRGDNAEAIKLADRVLEVTPNDEATVMLKSVSLAALGQRTEAVELLKSQPQLEASGKVSDQLLDLYLEAGELQAACDLATKLFAHNVKDFAPAHRVAEAMLQVGEADRALLLLDVIREAMTDGGEHEALSQSLQRAAERLPKRIEPREWLVELYGRTSDSFRMSDALADLAAACEAAGQQDRAREVYKQLLDREPDNDAARRKYENVKARLGGTSGGASAGSGRGLAGSAGGDLSASLENKGIESSGNVGLNTAANAGIGSGSGTAGMRAEASQSVSVPAPPAAPNSAEPPLDDATQQFVTQSLTDVDLFSSYGLTQKAIDLLEVVLQRAPRHTASIERLLDFYLGAGNERRTAELAAQLEQIHIEHGDRTSADRFAELRRRYERVVGMSSEQAVAAPQAAAPEFSVPMVEAEPISEAKSIPEPVALASAGRVETTENFSTTEPGVHEVDLSEEWAALTGVLTSKDSPSLEESDIEVIDGDETEELTGQLPSVALSPEPVPVQELAAAARVEKVQERPELAEFSVPVVPEAPSTANPPEFSLELEPLPEAFSFGGPVLDSAGFLSALSSELDAAVPALTEADVAAEIPANVPEAAAASTESIAPPATSSVTAAASDRSSSSIVAPESAVAPESSVESGWVTSSSSAQPSNSLSDVFDQFKVDMGEDSTEDEDLETHYNLGIAYREMGLLEEAISEFQKVAKANRQGQAFRYAMQCCTLLGLAFMEKGQPGIAAMWYDRALETPGLDQESILALRYDLGVAQELAGETTAARKSFSQVYGMNIDYRDVAERLGALGKGS